MNKIWDRTTTLLLEKRTEKLTAAFKRNDYDALAATGAILTEEGDWEYHLQESDLPKGSLRVPRVLLWSSRTAR